MGCANDAWLGGDAHNSAGRSGGARRGYKLSTYGRCYGLPTYRRGYGFAQRIPVGLWKAKWVRTEITEGIVMILDDFPYREKNNIIHYSPYQI